MKYVLPLMLVTSAALGAVRETAWDVRRLWPQAATLPPLVEPHVDPPWLTGAMDGAMGGAARHTTAGHEGDPHAGLYNAEDPHAGLYGVADTVAACPRDEDVAFDESANAAPSGMAAAVEPHESLRAHSASDEAGAIAVPPSSAANGRTVAAIFAERMALRDRQVRVRGRVVKRTDGILGKSYLHLRDGTGSPEAEDNDLTLTTNDEFQVGETVEVEGRLVIDQDLGIGYRYAALLEAASRVSSN